MTSQRTEVDWRKYLHLACYVNKRLTAGNSVDDNRLNGVKADNSLYMDRPHPSDNLGEI